ncbi:hypothetical protein HK102_010016 [Quaeritorhiza haematococci]|nr:hypothetical protein HK102_010016 [Quaeritorhiza haematococci]
MDRVLLEKINDKNLQMAVEDACKAHAPTAPVFARLIRYFCHHLENGDSSASLPTAKKRKLDSDNKLTAATPLGGDGELLYTVHDMSFSNPRKKLDMKLYERVIVLYSTKEGSVEAKYLVADLSDVLVLPTPNKTKPHWTVAFVFRQQQQPQNGSSGAASRTEPVLFGFDDKGGNLRISDGKAGTTTVIEKIESNKKPIVEILQKVFSKTVIEPNGNVFASAKSRTAKGALPQVHLECYLKAKEGFLYFLKQGLFFGFKKPCLFMPLASIESMRISSVTSRTFNLLVKDARSRGDGGSSEDGGGGEEYDFAMIDSQEYEGIQNYIAKHKSDWKMDTTTGQIKKHDPAEDNAESKNGAEAEANGISSTADDDDEEEDEDYAMPSDDSEVDEEYDSSARGSGDDGSDSDSDSDSEESDGEAEGDTRQKSKEAKPSHSDEGGDEEDEDSAVVEEFDELGE